VALFVATSGTSKMTRRENEWEIWLDDRSLITDEASFGLENLP
jgi:hypothetical protein